MTSVDETLPISDQDKETEPVNDEVETNTGGQETQIENNEKEKVNDEEQAPTSNKQQEQTPTEFCEEIKEKTRVQKLFECPKCKKMLTKKTLNYYHECTKNDVPKAKRRPKKQIVLEEIVEEIPERKAPSKASSRASSSTDPLPQVDATNIPVPRGIIEETSTSSGSGNGNGASSGSSQPLEERQPLISLEDIERMVKLERKSVSELRQLAREAVRNKNTNTDTFFLNRIGKKSELIGYIIEPKSASSSAPPPGPPQRPITSELIKTLITQYKKDRKDPQ